MPLCKMSTLTILIFLTNEVFIDYIILEALVYESRLLDFIQFILCAFHL